MYNNFGQQKMQEKFHLSGNLMFKLDPDPTQKKHGSATLLFPIVGPDKGSPHLLCILLTRVLDPDFLSRRADPARNNQIESNTI